MTDSPPSASEGERRAQHRRKPHHKSRTGCGDCRRRRVKCTEEKPRCRYCVRRDALCLYPPPGKAPKLTRPARRSRSGSRASQSADTQSPSSLADSTTFNLKDVALLHHWVTSTSLDLPNQPQANKLWQVDCPKISFQYPFVFYAILSVASLHRAYLEGRSGNSHIMDAANYHNEGLRRFQIEVGSQTDQNSEALFLWSGLNAIYVFAFSREPFDETTRARDPLAYDAWRDRVLGVEWIPLNRGITLLLKRVDMDLKQGRLATMFAPNNYFGLNPADIDDGFGGQELMRIAETWAGDSRAETFLAARECVRRCYSFMDQFTNPDRAPSRAECATAAMGLFVTIHRFPEEYLRLLRQRQPPALILFSFYGALIHRVRDYWVFAGWGKDIVLVISELLGAYWRPWIAWPLQVITEGDT